MNGFDNIKDAENIEVFFTVSVSVHDNCFKREQTLPYPHQYF